MTHFFSALLKMSIWGGFCILPVLLLRAVLRKAPKSITNWLWLPVALRLVCPVFPRSSFSLVPAPAVLPNPQIAEIGLVSPILPTPQPIPWQAVGCCIWAIGASVMLGYALFSYLRLLRQVSVSMRLQDRIFLCDTIPSPFLLGMGKPRIYLPSRMDPSQLRYVLSHEKAHLRHLDHITKPLAFGILTLHWFNPLCWLAYLLLSKDLELAADERVIRTMDVPEKKAYSTALLQCSAKPSLISVAFGEVAVRQRILAILRYRKPSAWVIRLSCLLAVVLAAGLLTNPAAEPIPEKSAVLSETEPTQPLPIAEETTVPTEAIPEETETIPQTEETIPETVPETTPETQPAPLPAHDFSGGITVVFDCVNGGTRTYSCSHCDWTFTEPIAPTGSHSFTPNWAILRPASCTQWGMLMRICDACGYMDVQTDSSQPPRGHFFEAQFTIPATENAGGYTQYGCALCGEIKTDNFTPALGNTEEPNVE